MDHNSDKNANDQFENAWETSAETDVSKEVIAASWENFKKSKLKKKPARYKPLLAYAAMIAILFSTAFYLNVDRSVETISSVSITDKQVLLPDGSQVYLKKNAQITYSKDFNKNREVSLSGEAYFDVESDNGKEFKVKTGKTTTTVLGTSFKVHEDKDGASTRISLYSGKIMVSVEDQPRQWKLSAGERLTYENKQTLLDTFNPELSFEGENEVIDLNEIKLKDLFPFLEERFKIRFEYKSSNTEEKITFRMHQSDSLSDVLNILSLITTNSYEIDTKANTVTTSK